MTATEGGTPHREHFLFAGLGGLAALLIGRAPGRGWLWPGRT
jgi:hypothetical protein